METEPKPNEVSLPISRFHGLTVLPSRLFILLIRMYQATRPVRMQVCRYDPSCSEYAAQSIQKYGLVRGFALGIRRILRCNPLSPGGYDPVP